MGHSPHLGYVSLFPLLLGILPPSSPWARPLLDAMDPASKGALIAAHGVPSLSPKDPLFGKGENYWRGKIWGNLNYLAISALGRNAFSHGDKESGIHKEVRQRFVS